MRRIVLALVYLWLTTGQAASDADQPHRWSIETSIATRYFERSPDALGDFVVPDGAGRRLFVLTRRGDLEADSNVYELLVFDGTTFTDSHESPQSRAQHRVSFASNDNQPAISQARWVDRGAGIAFLATSDNTTQVHRLDLATGEVRQLTSNNLGVVAFDTQNGAVIYIAKTAESADPALAYYPARLLDRDYIEFFEQEPPSDTYALFVARAGGTRQVGAPLASPYYMSNVWLSPNGATAILATRLAPGSEPSEWRSYYRPSQSSSGFEQHYWQQFFQVRIASGERRALLNAPTGFTVGNIGIVSALWLDDSETVLLFNTCLPRSADTRRRITSYVVQYNTRSSQYREIDPLTNGMLRSVGWTRSSDQFRAVFRSRRSGAPYVTYTRTDARWTTEDIHDAGFSVSNYRVELTQSSGQPPALVASQGNDEITLLAPDPILSDVAISEPEAISWTDETGHAWTGFLSLPPGANRGQSELPLVAQLMARTDPRLFEPDGSQSTAYATQSLNAASFVVLNVATSNVWGLGTPDEGPSFVAGLDSAIALLVQEGTIDGARVGLVGHSRAGYLTQYAVTHPGHTLLAAAVAADAFSGGYFEYMNADADGTAEMFERLYGGPFWTNRDTWLQLAPTFNADRAQTPLLLAPIGRLALIGTQEMYASLQRNNKPVDLLYFPVGAHTLVRPQERFASMSATVDWMNFWILGIEDPSPLKRAQYDRWETLRSATTR